MFGWSHRELNVIFSKSGSGSDTAKISIPITFLQELRVDENNRLVNVDYDCSRNAIIITKFNKC